MQDTQQGESNARRALKRFADRWMAVNRHRLDAVGGLLARQLDAWNQQLAERSIPRARRERVEALLRERGGANAQLRVVSARSESDQHPGS